MKLKPQLHTLFLLITAGAAGSVVFTTLGIGVWPLEILTAFCVQSTALLLVIAVAAAVKQQWVWTGASAVLSIVGLTTLWPYAMNETIPLTPASGYQYVKIGHVNLLSHSGGIDAVNHWAAMNHIAILEVTELPSSEGFDIDKAFASFPYKLVGTQPGRRKVAILSKFPLMQMQTTNNLTLSARVTLEDETTLNIVSTHPSVAILPRRQSQRDQSIRTAFAEAAKYEFSIVIGDFNATPWSPVLRQEAEAHGFARTHGGLFSSTWITPLPLFGLTIDHIYTSNLIKAWNTGGGPFIYSDHWPIFATVAVPKPGGGKTID